MSLVGESDGEGCWCVWAGRFVEEVENGWEKLWIAVWGVGGMDSTRLVDGAKGLACWDCRGEDGS